jgi:hypothetical protein
VGRSGGGTALHRLHALIARAEQFVHDLAQRLSAVELQTMLAVHALLVLSACWLAFSRRWWTTTLAWLGVIGFSLLWFGVSHRWEGRIVYEVSPNHGLTEADLVVPVLVAAALVVRCVRFTGRALLRLRQQRLNAGVPTAFRTMWPKN